MDNKSLAATKPSDALQGQQIAELERTISELHGALHDLATSALHLLDMSPPRRPTDAVIIGDIVKRARRALAYLSRHAH